MQISSTLIRADAEQAKAIAAKEDGGLLGKLVNKFKKSKPTEVLDAKLFYYPLYVGGAVLSFGRAAKLPDRKAVDMAVMECAFGYTQRMRGTPETQMLDVDKADIVRRKFSEKDARQRISDFLRKSGYRKYRSIPEVDFHEFYLVYKPYYVCRCKRGAREFLRVVDAEISQRDFMLDIKYKDLAFER